MRKKIMLLTAVVCLLAINSCKKNETANNNADAQTQQAKGAIKKTNAITGSYATYTITNVTSGFAAEVGGFTTYGQKQDNGRAVQQWQASATPERWQKWNVIDLGTGYYKIVNLYSGKVLDAPNATQGVALTQYDSHGGTNQQWQLTVVSTGVYKVINRSNGLALTNEASSTTNGTAVTQRTYVNNGSQWWAFNLFARDSYRDNELTNFFKRTTGSTAFDGVFSVPMTYGANNGKVMWPTNDTYWNSINANGSTNCLGGENQPIAYRCSNLVQPAQSSGAWNYLPGATNNITSASNGNQFFPIQAGTSWTWPSGGIEVGSHVYIYADEGNGLSPTSEGIYDINMGALPTYTVTRLNTPALSGQTAIRYMHGMIKVTDAGINYVYVYGAANGGDVYLARFLQSSPTTWTFWNGSSWASAPTTAAAAKIATMPWGGFWVAAVSGKYVIASMDFGFGCDITQRHVYTSFSVDPKSGWSPNKIVYDLPDFKQGHTPVFYQAAIHPQFSTNNELVFTYCVNFYGSCLAACSNPDGSMDPNDYRAKAVRIPYALIGI